jgi:hypothetical protein
MILRKTLFAATLLAPALIGGAGAAVIASTTFDGQTQTGNTASNLNWTLNGVDDPGDMSAFNATPAAQNLFSGNPLVQNMFAPGINTGNGNTFWTTTVNLTVASGSIVTLTDVTFDNWSVNGGQNQNVNRNNEFTVTLVNPSAITLDAVTIADSLSGTAAGVPTVTATFTAPITLADPGTYTLEIKGGDFTGFNETGNHTAIDNLSINGDVTVIPEPSSVFLSGLGIFALLFRRRR